MKSISPLAVIFAFIIPLAFAIPLPSAAETGPTVVRLVKDINPGSGSSLVSLPYTPIFTEFKGKVYFKATDGSSVGEELWMTDGTSSGTVLVKDINIGSINSGSSQITSMVVAGDLLFISANDGDFVHGRELWVSDGTTEGTVMVKELDGMHDTPDQLVPFGDQILFELCATTPLPNPRECDLWISDGTADGTYRVADIPTEYNLVDLSVAGTQAFFFATTPSEGSELWVSDGTETGTHIVEDLIPGPDSAILGNSMIVVGNIVLFNAFYSNYEYACLTRSDGTPEGTWPIPRPGLTPEYDFLAAQMNAIENIAVFTANHPDYVQIPYITDGTVEGTRDMGIYQASALYDIPVRLGDYIYQSMAVSGQTELYRFGESGQFELFLDLRGTKSSGPVKLITLHDHLYFTAYSDTYLGRIFYRTDGTEGNYEEFLLIDPQSMVKIGDRIYMAANINGSGVEPWVIEEIPLIYLHFPLIIGN